MNVILQIIIQYAHELLDCRGVFRPIYGTHIKDDGVRTVADGINSGIYASSVLDVEVGGLSVASTIQKERDTATIIDDRGTCFLGTFYRVGVKRLALYVHLVS